jgi:hypothetical protein
MRELAVKGQLVSASVSYAFLKILSLLFCRRRILSLVQNYGTLRLKRKAVMLSFFTEFCFITFKGFCVLRVKRRCIFMCSSSQYGNYVRTHGHTYIVCARLSGTMFQKGLSWDSAPNAANSC